MFALPLILAAGGLFTLSIGAPLPSNNERDSFTPSVQERSTANTYTVYSGDGDTNKGWPTLSDWISSFDTMFEDQNSVLTTSCTQFDVDNNSDDEIADLKEAITEVANTTGIDSRFILAIIMQESNGCVRAPTTTYSVSNPGLMQSHDGTGTCNSGTTVQNPCPKTEMVQMITDGTSGTSSGDGLKQCLAESDATDVSMYYKAARIYNSGSIASGGNLGDGDATACYATDVANRLTGWYSGTSACDSATIGELDGTTASAASSAVSSVVSVVSSVLSVATSALSVPSVTIPSITIPTSVDVSISLGISLGNGYVASSTAATTTATATASALDILPFVISASSASSSSASETGGVFVEVASSSSISTTSAVTTAISVPTVAVTSVATSVPTASLPSTITTASAPLSTSSTSTSTNTTSTSYTPGTSCTTAGTWNCIDGDSFQQCASGTWSSIVSLAAGTSCTTGEGSTIDIYASDSSSGSKHKHKRHADARKLAHSHMHGVRRSVGFVGVS